MHVPLLATLRIPPGISSLEREVILHIQKFRKIK
jgi:hypothetical protein